MWTNASLEPSSGAMNSKPLVVLNHFTVPVGMVVPLDGGEVARGALAPETRGYPRCMRGRLLLPINPSGPRHVARRFLPGCRDRNRPKPGVWGAGLRGSRQTRDSRAADIDLAAAAVNLVHEGEVDCFCIVSGDSDFTGLATRLREAGKTAVGMGKLAKMSKAFQKARSRVEFVGASEEQVLRRSGDGCRPARFVPLTRGYSTRLPRRRSTGHP